MKFLPSRQAKLAAAMCLIPLWLGACATDTPTDEPPVVSTTAPDPRDPWEAWNRDVQGFNDGVDEYVMQPVAKGYKYITPEFVDTGITNFYSNINDISVFLNDFLQWKPMQGGEDMGRFLINTTVGVGGFIDVADYLGLSKHREDFDQTLAVWGIPSGPYLVLPFFGPSTPRGVGGLVGDSATNPINYVAPGIVPLLSGTLRVTDQEADNKSGYKVLDAAAKDRYEFLRNAYFQEREAKIHDGNPPLDVDFEHAEQELDAELEKESAKPAASESVQ
jgi:phospholipid-binding lipoprotein MlaA